MFIKRSLLSTCFASCWMDLAFSWSGLEMRELFFWLEFYSFKRACSVSKLLLVSMEERRSSELLPTAIGVKLSKLRLVGESEMSLTC